MASSSHSSNDETVLLTGSTGALGSNLLALFLQEPRVKTVWALNRTGGEEAIVKQRNAFVDQGLDVNLLDTGKVQFLKVTLNQTRFGLAEDVFDGLQRTTTSIVHNAWKLDFNMSLASFEPFVAGTKNLVEFSRTNTPRFYFVSSVGAAQNWDKSNGPVPEGILTDPKVAVGGGYGASKYISERIVADSGLAGCSFRIGQITGGCATGAWSTTDWFPILVKTSISMGILPDAPGITSWIQMDHVAYRIAHTVMNYNQLSPPSVVNVVHPNPVPWKFILLTLSEALVQTGITNGTLPLVPFGEWYGRLEAAAKDPSILDKLPAAKMLGFYGMLATNSARVASDAESLGFATFTTSGWVGEIATINAVDVKRWVEFWILKNLI